MSEWQPIETAPVGEEVLVWGLYQDRPVIGTKDALSGWFATHDGGLVVEHMSDFGTEHKTLNWPTHWMPLPQPPTDREQNRTTENLEKTGSENG